MDRGIRRAIMAGVATVAMFAAPLALAQGQGNGNGNRGGGGNGGGKAEQSQRGNGGGGGQERGNGGNRGNGGGGEARGNGNRGGGGNEARSERGNGGGGSAQRGNGGGNERAGGNANRGNGGGNANRGNGGGNGNDFRSNGNGNRGNGNGNRNGGGNGNRGNGGGRDGGLIDLDLDVDFALPVLRQAYGTAPRMITGCPPGLAKKRNGCLPPGQARQRYRSYDPGFFGLFGADRGSYFYDDGYLLRYGDGGLSGYIPLLGGALRIGEAWPSYYEPRPLPNYYRDYYRLGDVGGYRYADNVIYRIEPESAAILGVAALLTGDEITIGQPMPRGYDVYNVPYDYRDRYYDRPGRRYRYSDGYVYEIDTETALVIAAIRLVS